jgi:aryl-alcohol dehydrogenase-like predicted oxidoreductase
LSEAGTLAIIVTGSRATGNSMRVEPAQDSRACGSAGQSTGVSSMNYTLLGRSGLKVSSACLGTMTFGEFMGMGADEAQSRRMFDAYLASGGNFIDTANIYSNGQSERMLGEFIAAERARLVVASKFSMSTQAQDPNAGGNSRKNLHQALDASLKRLRTDYIDLYWVHAWDGNTPLDELLRGLDDAVRAGKVLYVGFSNVPAWVVARAQTLAELRAQPRFVALQLHYSLIERGIERELMPCASALGMAVTAWSPLAGGALTGKYSRDPAERAKQPGRLTQSGWGASFLTDRNFAIIDAATAVAQRLGTTATRVALRWLTQRANPVIPILGARSMAQLDEQLGADTVKLDDAALAELDAVGRHAAAYPQSLLDAPRGRAMLHGEAMPRVAGLYQRDSA